MKAVITVYMDSDAFAKDPHFELAQILDLLAHDICDTKCEQKKLLDSNGNHVGAYTIIRDEWRGFRVGDRVVMLVQAIGDNTDGEETVHPPGTHGEIIAVCDFGPPQGRGVDIAIGEGDATIINTFDDMGIADMGFTEKTGCPWFRHVDD